MAIDGDDEILQDFLIEAGEILELLGEQLVDLERKPQDSELLNAIFRGFHTVKGGAGFLGITSLVEICHCTEDVFNLLRQGSVVVDAGIMDIVLRSLDSVNEMFDGVRGGQEPAAADTELLQQLRYIADHGLAPGGNAAPAVSQAAVAEAASPAAVEAEAKNAPAPDDDFTDLEFQALLDAAANSKEATAAESAPPPSEAGEGISPRTNSKPCSTNSMARGSSVPRVSRQHRNPNPSRAHRRHHQPRLTTTRLPMMSSRHCLTSCTVRGSSAQILLQPSQTGPWQTKKRPPSTGETRAEGGGGIQANREAGIPTGASAGHATR